MSCVLMQFVGPSGGIVPVDLLGTVSFLLFSFIVIAVVVVMFACLFTEYCLIYCLSLSVLFVHFCSSLATMIVEIKLIY